MKSHFLLILAFSYHFLSILSQNKLEMVISLSRHGARSPNSGGIYINKYWSSLPLGELTPVGMKQHYLIGKELRKRYSTFLSSTYNSSEIYIRSTNLNRTLMSAVSQLYGLYGLNTAPQIPSTLKNISLANPPINLTISDEISALGLNSTLQNYQPFPIHTVDDTKDPLLDPVYSCERLNDYLTGQQDSQFWLNLYSDMENTIETVRTTLKMSKDDEITLKDLSTLYENIYECDYVNNVNDSPQFSPEIQKNLSMIWDLYEIYNLYGTDQLVRLFNSNLFNKIVELFDMRALYNVSNNPKFTLFSVHDTNIHGLLAGFNISNYQCIYDKYTKGSLDDFFCPGHVPFSSTFILELSSNSSGFFVQIRFNDKVYNPWNSSDGFINYQDFRPRLLGRTIDYYSLCNIQEDSSDLMTFTIVAVVMNVLALAFFTMLIQFIKLKRSVEERGEAEKMRLIKDDKEQNIIDNSRIFKEGNINENK